MKRIFSIVVSCITMLVLAEQGKVHPEHCIKQFATLFCHLDNGDDKPRTGQFKFIGHPREDQDNVSLPNKMQIHAKQHSCNVAGRPAYVTTLQDNPNIEVYDVATNKWVPLSHDLKIIPAPEQQTGEQTVAEQVVITKCRAAKKSRTIEEAVPLTMKQKQQKIVSPVLKNVMKQIAQPVTRKSQKKLDTNLG